MLGALMIVGGVVVILSTPVSFGWFAYQPVEPVRILVWQDVVGPITICVGAVLLALGSYLLGRRSREG
ncbi:hypothetical protein SGUI_3120 [Serinicoccus hydrothermalis]|uniref:Uncharacterized protein n=1 Tax=Serinicoccus hydrothermalis TaxID=1758689 RepID=A0A1B1NGG2_9MICO|nr:hypothetical protein SGUI_3120 [Serinicoccus hydrothermalis]